MILSVVEFLEGPEADGAGRARPAGRLGGVVISFFPEGRWNWCRGAGSDLMFKTPSTDGIGKKTGALIRRIGTRARYASCGRLHTGAAPEDPAPVRAADRPRPSPGRRSRGGISPCYRKTGKMSSAGRVTGRRAPGLGSCPPASPGRPGQAVDEHLGGGHVGGHGDRVLVAQPGDIEDVLVISWSWGELKKEHQVDLIVDDALADLLDAPVLMGQEQVDGRPVASATMRPVALVAHTVCLDRTRSTRCRTAPSGPAFWCVP